ncbi:HNH endonuclease [Natrinema sp. DC36]|uniref:HNH endonuclease n=1 Tax=Natrinema sp. DC36 TaxID=2878680 RepID=UPI001CF0A5E5|nr:HNH endonuclease [Natrinema sp. DC36]
MIEVESGGDIHVQSVEEKPWRDKDLLWLLYIEHDLMQREVAALFGCHRRTVIEWCRRFDIKKPRQADTETRFWSKVNDGDHDECWEWTAALSSTGYGSIYFEGRYQNAQRVAYTLENGDPGDQMILHHCDNRKCVNPEHLYAGDASDNMQDMWDRERHPEPDAVGEKNPSAKLTDDEVREIKQKLADGIHPRQLAGEYGVHKTNIGEIGRENIWTHVEP